MRRFLVDGILFAVVLILSITMLVPQLKRHMFFIDEYEFMRKSYLFDVYFLKQNLGDPRWTDAALESDAPQPKVGPYIFGLALHLSGVRDIETAFRQSGFSTIQVDGHPWWEALWTKEPSKFPDSLAQSFSYILIGRRAAAVFSIASILFIFLLGTTLHSSVLGFIAAILFLVNPLFRLEAGFAMTDTMQLAFFLLTVLLLVYWRGAWQEKSYPWLMTLSVGIGLAASLAAGVKVTGMLAMLFVGMHQVYIYAWEEMTAALRRMLVLSTATMVVVFWSVFYALHPYIHTDTFRQLRYMYQARMNVSQTLYAQTYPHTYIPTRIQALRYVLMRTMLPYSLYGNFSHSWIPWDMMLVLGGSLVLVNDVFIRWKKSGVLPRLAILPLWISFTAVSLVWYLSHDWSRYYLPVVSGITILEAYMITYLFFRFGGGVLYDRLPK